MHDLAIAFGDLLLVKEFSQAAKRISSDNVHDDTKEAIQLMFRLDALTRIHKNLTQWLEVEYFSGDHVAMIKRQIKLTLKAVKRHVVAITYGYNVSEEQTDSMLAPQDGDLYGSIVRRIYSAPKAFERISNWRELYH